MLASQPQSRNPMFKKCIVRLTDEERWIREDPVKRLSGASQKVRRARILLHTAAAGPIPGPIVRPPRSAAAASPHTRPGISRSRRHGVSSQHGHGVYGLEFPTSLVDLHLLVHAELSSACSSPDRNRCHNQSGTATSGICAPSTQPVRWTRRITTAYRPWSAST